MHTHTKTHTQPESFLICKTHYELTQVYLCCGLLLKVQPFSQFPSSMCQFRRQMSQSATKTHKTFILRKNNRQISSSRENKRSLRSQHFVFKFTADLLEGRRTFFIEFSHTNLFQKRFHGISCICNTVVFGDSFGLTCTYIFL